MFLLRSLGWHYVVGHYNYVTAVLRILLLAQHPVHGASPWRRLGSAPQGVDGLRARGLARVAADGGAWCARGQRRHFPMPGRQDEVGATARAAVAGAYAALTNLPMREGPLVTAVGRLEGGRTRRCWKGGTPQHRRRPAVTDGPRVSFRLGEQVGLLGSSGQGNCLQSIFSAPFCRHLYSSFSTSQKLEVVLTRSHLKLYEP